ncbi:Ribosomal protein S6 kinase beta-1 [Zancudomyces culisetae]|uniref:Ribosomal protein S6 kinase beta-1 n=1 Tax=Zancudomyces culisetae TaxID=1213189 RepID=A0A1R1PZE3_ZANCU|nr:Ribosomal protein S6 kinase beta-1 [Zancudomyces culisetae]|eukprot:OMH86314.1 Ribosomal protein S6 kinase beta-1 [Zancudomyces culisetae]
MALFKKRQKKKQTRRRDRIEIEEPIFELEHNIVNISNKLNGLVLDDKKGVEDVEEEYIGGYFSDENEAERNDEGEDKFGTIELKNPELMEIDIERGLQNESVDEDGIVKSSRAPINKVNLGSFSILKLLGVGGYGKVYLVKKNDSQKVYAMKVMKKATIRIHKNQAAFSKTERTILEEVQHPFIVKLYFAFQCEERLYLIIDYISGGELFFHMAKERIFTEAQAVFYIAELTLALGHLHKLGIIYRDLKPENCLLNSLGHLVLTDFGLSKTAIGEGDSTNTFCGTPSYMAPEIFNLDVPYEKSVDWWSLGVLLYEMLTGRVPFFGKSHKQVFDNINKSKIQFPKYISGDSADFIRKLLKKNPQARLGFGVDGLEKVKAHRFFFGSNWKVLIEDPFSIIPPIVPVLNGDDDTSNFDKTFTEAAVSIFNDSSETECGYAQPVGTQNIPIPRNKKNNVMALEDDAGVGSSVSRSAVPDDFFMGFSYVAKSYTSNMG